MLPWQLIEINKFKLTIIQWPRAITNNKWTIKVCYVPNLRTSYNSLKLNVLIPGNDALQHCSQVLFMHAFKLVILSGLSSLTPNKLVLACLVTDKIPPNLNMHKCKFLFRKSHGFGTIREWANDDIIDIFEWDKLITENLMD